jgi:hypothetical protein
MQRQDAAHRLPLLQAWLQQSGQQVTSLSITLTPDRVAGMDLRNPDCIGTLQLPVSKLASLKELSLECIDLDLAPDNAVSTAQQQSKPSKSRRAKTAAAAAAVAAGNSASNARLGGAGGTHSLLPALQRFQLQDCTLDTIASLGQLAQSSVLTSLQLEGIAAKNTPSPQLQAPWGLGFIIMTGDDSSARGSPSGKFSSAIASLLQRLPGLQVLAIQASPPGLLQPTAVSSISAMHSLQDLSMRFGAVMASHKWPTVLPHGLTRLEIAVENVVIDKQPARIQACLKSLQDMQHLQELHLQLCDLDPAC